jgi:hypothetical protein
MSPDCVIGNLILKKYSKEWSFWSFAHAIPLPWNIPIQPLPVPLVCLSGLEHSWITLPVCPGPGMTFFSGSSQPLLASLHTGNIIMYVITVWCNIHLFEFLSLSSVDFWVSGIMFLKIILPPFLDNQPAIKTMEVRHNSYLAELSWLIN